MGTRTAATDSTHTHTTADSTHTHTTTDSTHTHTTPMQDVARYQAKIGCFIQIPNVGRGQLKFVGSVDSKPGTYAGVDLLANIGKNNGSFNGKSYFHTEYPRSGLFIQLHKVASLIEESATASTTNANAFQSRRSTLTSANFGLHQNSSGTNLLSPSVHRNHKRINSTASTESTVITKQNLLHHNSNINTLNAIANDDLRTPTPTRNLRMSSTTSSVDNNHLILNNNNNNNSNSAAISNSTLNKANINTNTIDDQEMDIDIETPISTAKTITNTNNELNSNNINLITDYEIKLEKQNRKLLEYERLLNEQRMVLEDIQPAIDEYERTIHQLSKQNESLNQQLLTDKEDFNKQLQYYATENKQLTDVVTELHEELKANELHNSNNNNNATNSNDDSHQDLQRQLDELTKYKQDMEYARVKWDKERDQLKMHNDSLSKEYQELNKELMLSISNTNSNTGNDDDANVQHLKDEVAKLKNELTDAQNALSNIQQTEIQNSLPAFKPPKQVDATAGRELWCALCEKSGHVSIDCPFQYQSTSKPATSQSESIDDSTQQPNKNIY